MYDVVGISLEELLIQKQFTPCCQCIHHIIRQFYNGGEYIDAWMKFNMLQHAIFAVVKPVMLA